ncbi:MAG: glucans biosynthesis glucosyltransferase MdoH [Gammaproteobacteria bacterium]|nr:glucans biosynthesis glucosyltransferase MdoH [Gammaproteobacteria bacterium]
MDVDRKWRRAGHWRRALFLALTLLTAAAATAMMGDILAANGLTVLKRSGLVLFYILFVWITGAFWTAFAGFLVRLRGGDPVSLKPQELAGRPLASRTAIIMPIYNEDTARVIAGLDVIWSSLVRLPEQGAFDLFILSDTRKLEIAAAEEVAWRELAARHHARGRIFYRRRAENIGRKAGNIADFVRAWGGAYDYAIVLDADSIMSGEALVTLARLMDAHPQAGIIQALPLPAGRETFFARLIQFAARLSSPMLASGLSWWQLGDGNYWGHNAILRLKPFAAFCDLPRLPGAPPLGGEILSHDFVEAAFMRRAGFQVWLVPDDTGSWEEVPSNIIDYAARDRRWAQGNLQHLGLLPMRGLHWLSRLHLVTGVLSYASSPLWLLVLVLSSTVVILDAIHGYQYFKPGSYALFPTWPQYRDGEIVALLSITVAVLFLPKFFGALLAVKDSRLRRGFGGGARLFASLGIEQLFSILLAPAMMLFHTTFVVTTLAGKPVVWHAQERGDRGIGVLEALLRHKWHLAIGIAWGAVILAFAPRYIWWLAPVLAGMVLAVPLTVVTSRTGAGLWLRKHRLLLTPEEAEPPMELVALQARLAPGASAIGAVEIAPATSTGVAAHDSNGATEPLELPERVPLAMQAQPPRYLTPRDALRIGRWKGVNSTSAS